MSSNPQRPGARRCHPDIFTSEEAAAYLRLPTEATLEWLRQNGFLDGHMIGKTLMYHREDLDACAYRMFGKAVPGRVPKVG
jgi:hypothetical protein